MTTERNFSMRQPVPFNVRRASTRAFALMLVSAVLAVGAAEAQTREPGRFFERLDTNGDGVADAEELLAARREAFERADTDGNDFLTGREVEQLVGDRADMTRTRRGGLAGGIARRRMPDAEDGLRRLDTDGDSRISKVEFVEARNPLLERFDANRDGKISRDEVERAQQRMRDQVRRRRVL